MELLIGDENHSLPLCVHVAAFGITGHVLAIVVMTRPVKNLSKMETMQ